MIDGARLSFFVVAPFLSPTATKIKKKKKKVSSLHCKSLPFATETDHKHSSSKLTNKKMGYEQRASSFWFHILTWTLNWWYLHSREELRSYWFVCAGGETGIAVPRSVFQFWGQKGKWIQDWTRSCKTLRRTQSRTTTPVTSAELTRCSEAHKHYHCKTGLVRMETKLSRQLPALCSTGKLADRRETVSICELAQLNLLIWGTNGVVPSLVIPPLLSLLICWFLFCQSTQYRRWGLISRVCFWECSAKIILRTIHRAHQGLDTTPSLSFNLKSDLVFRLLTFRWKEETLLGGWLLAPWKDNSSRMLVSRPLISINTSLKEFAVAY